MAEASAYKSFKEKADEIAILKNNMKTNKSEMDALRRDLNERKKMMKEKGKKSSDLVRSVTIFWIMLRS